MQNKTKKICFLVFFLYLTVLSFSKEKGTIYVGIENISFAPFYFVDENNELKGYDIDLIQEISSRLGVSFVIKKVTSQSQLELLTNGSVDCLWDVLVSSLKNKKVLTFTEPYLTDSQCIIVKENSSIEKLSDLQGKILGLQDDSYAYKLFCSNKQLKNIFAEKIMYNNFSSLLSAVENTTVNAAIVDKYLIQYFITETKQPLKILDIEFSPQIYTIVFRNSDISLKKKIQKVFSDMKNDGTFFKISNKWFGFSVNPTN